MDDTTQTNTFDAATTRKRRSSILKSQRPPRTPFCELEFNVCTPTDSAKSRRVSFSRRTGVAEFATNEATTTWKNFYEEHNKSFESGNDSGANSRKETISHLGKRIFDQQFEEVEAVDFLGSINTGVTISTSIDTANFAQMKCTDTNITAPQNNFELSAFTEQQTKLFGDDLAITCPGEVTDRIDVNFSSIQQIGENDDLDEIQKDLQMQRNNGCHGLFDRQNLSEYIEVDLNTTHVAVAHDESDMSITDTVHSPKVQDISRSCSIENKRNDNQDWETDKENIVLNPYIAPRESENFAINDEVLIFDGKKLVIRTEKSTNENCRQTLLPNPTEQAPQRKTIVVNCNDDLPNFTEDAQSSRNISSVASVSGLNKSMFDENQRKHRTILYDDDLGDISVTQVVPTVIPNAEKRRTIVFENDTGNISITQAIPSKIIDKERRRTVVYENGDNNISITQAVPTNVPFLNDNNEKRKTILFENEACDISMTQALPAHIIAPENAPIRNRTIVMEDCTANMSITQPISDVRKLTKETRRTVVYEDNTGNISVTQSVASSLNLQGNVALPERRRTIVFESDIGNISVTQALPTNIIIPQKLNVTSYANEANISITQAIPTNILFGDNKEQYRRRTVVYEDDTGNLSITQAVPTTKVLQSVVYNQQTNTELTDIEIATNDVLHAQRPSDNNRKVVVESYNEDLSITEAVNLNQVLPGVSTQQKSRLEKSIASPEKVTENKRRTIVFQNDDADISMTQAVNVNQLLLGQYKEEKQNVTHDELEAATNTALHCLNSPMGKRRQTVKYDDEGNKSVNHDTSRNVSLLDGQEKKPTTSEEDALLENRTLFKQLDELTDGLKEHESSILLNEKKNDLFMTKVGDANRSEHRTIAFEYDNEMSITQVVFDNFNTKVTPEKTEVKETSTSSKPIPARLSMIQSGAFDKSLNRLNDVKEHDSLIVDVTNAAVNDVLIYQTASANKENLVKDYVQELNAIPMEDEKDVSTDMSTPLGSPKMRSQMNLIDKDGENEQGTATESNLIKPLSTKDSKGFDPKNAILNDLLDMSNSSLTAEADKSILVKLSSEEQRNSADDMFLITNDSEVDVQVDKNTSMSIAESKTKINNSLAAVKNTKDEEPVIENLQQKLNELKSVLKETVTSSSPKEQHSPNLPPVSNMESNESLNVSKRRTSKCIKTANDTNELLEMLSDFTDKRMSRKLDPPLEESEEDTPAEHLALENIENKKDPEKRRFSILPRRQSMALSREDLLNNLSLAGEALRKSRFELDENDTIDTTKETPMPNISSKKAGRRSSEVVKTLHFEDEDTVIQNTESKHTTPQKTTEGFTRNKKGSNQSMELSMNETVDLINQKVESNQINESHITKNVDMVDQNDVLRETMKSPDFASLESELNPVKETPLKKTAFGEVSYMKDSRSRVIPDFADVSDNVKELMHDLVKPMADVLPFTTTSLGHDMKRNASTCSTEIQTNLLNTSQVDLHSEIYSNSESIFDGLNKFSPVNIISDAVNKSLSRALTQSPEWSAAKLAPAEKILECDTALNNNPGTTTNQVCESNKTPPEVLIFDHTNPLNNVFIAPPLDINVHSYNPIQKTQLTPECDQSAEILACAVDNVIESDCKTETSSNEPIKNEHPMQTMVAIPMTVMGDTDKSCPLSKSSIESKPLVYDQYTEPRTGDTKDTEVNTVIVMKGNKELLEASSSLTLVDDANRSKFALNLKHEVSESPLQVIYKLDESPAEKPDTDFATDIAEKHNKKKRSLSPKAKGDEHRHCTLSSLDVTPKPASKMQKRSNSPTVQSEPVSPEELYGSISAPIKQALSVISTEQDRSISPPIQQAISPKIQTAISPTLQGGVSPMIKREVSQMQQEVVSPRRERTASPKRQRAASPLTQRAVSPKKQRVFSPTTQRAVSSTTQRVVIPTTQPAVSSTTQRAVSSTTQRAVSSTTQRAVSSTTQRAVSSTTQRAVSSTLQRVVSPKTQRTVIATVLESRNSTYVYEKPTRLTANKDKYEIDEEKLHSNVREPSRPFKKNELGASVTAQQLMTAIHRGEAYQDNCPQNEIENRQCVVQDTSGSVTESTSCAEVEIASSPGSSFTSKGNLRSELRGSSSEKPLELDSVLQTCSAPSSQAAESESEVDIISELYSMPFMGKAECECESLRGDTWSFLLLHSRLRFVVQFEESARVRASTRVLNMELQTLRQEKKNPIAYLCVSFAAETMRFYIGRGCARARQVTRLVRQLSGAARLAARWARAMQDARARLAYSLSPDGRLALKVANMTLRTVWEVTMQLEMVVEDAGSAPCARAGGVRVARVLPDAAACAAPALRTLCRDTPRDWGHVPRTIWKVFRYLKHKNRADDLALEL